MPRVFFVSFYRSAQFEMILCFTNLCCCCCFLLFSSRKTYNFNRNSKKKKTNRKALKCETISNSVRHQVIIFRSFSLSSFHFIFCLNACVRASVCLWDCASKSEFVVFFSLCFRFPELIAYNTINHFTIGQFARFSTWTQKKKLKINCPSSCFVFNKNHSLFHSVMYYVCESFRLSLHFRFDVVD